MTSIDDQSREPTFPSLNQRHNSTKEACGAARHAAAALAGLIDRTHGNTHSKVGAAPISLRSEDGVAVKTAKKKRIYKKRKATHTVRKEEKLALKQEIEMLQKELELLKYKTMVEKDEEVQSEKKRRAKTTVLKEAVQEQHLVLARARAMLAERPQQWIHRVHPTEMRIRLGEDRYNRMKTLSALRRPKLELARRFLMERVRGLSPTSPYYQEERYNTIDGDYCIERFDVTPFRGAKGGVQEVFAALQQAASNAEIIVSESTGNITIRDDDELEDEHFSHKRFVSHMSLGVQIESNLVLFSDCQVEDLGPAEDNYYAIMATDFVDDDAKYPYRPYERIRRDSTTVTMVTSCRDAAAGVVNTDGLELVVVVKRWALTIVRRPSMIVPGLFWDEVLNSQVRWTDLMFKCVRQAIGLPVVL